MDFLGLGIDNDIDTTLVTAINSKIKVNILKTHGPLKDQMM